MSYISRIQLTDIKCFAGDVTFELPQPTDGQASCTVVLGANGTGKSTILRSVAMGLCDRTGASGLLAELPVPMIRHGCEKATVSLDVTSPGDPRETFTLTTEFVRADPDNEYIVPPAQSPPISLRRNLFVCAYGAALGTIGSEVVDRYRVADAVYSLFNYEARLQNPENALFRISEQPGIKRQDLLDMIDRILLLPERSTKLDAAGLSLRGPWGDYIPARGLGDGYAATLARICDLLGWSLLALGKRFDGKVRGIVLIDEIEQHLHPSWQRRIIHRLTTEFPLVQFIVTTHTPLVVIGSAPLPNEQYQLIHLKHDDSTGNVRVRSDCRRPTTHQRADQVLTSYLFGLTSTSSNELINKVERYAHLKRNPSEGPTELSELADYLNQALGTPETELQRTVERAVLTTLRNMAVSADHQSLLFETRRQILEHLDLPATAVPLSYQILDDLPPAHPHQPAGQSTPQRTESQTQAREDDLT